MKLENQVCTYDQAVKLQELGINQQSTFYYVKTKSKVGHENCSLFFGITAALKQYNDWQKHDAFLESHTQHPVATWNNAELSVMLPDEYVQPRHSVSIHTYKKECAFGESHTRFFCSLNLAELLKQKFYTEAQARAAVIIYMLEHDLITADSINQKLFFA